MVPMKRNLQEAAVLRQHRLRTRRLRPIVRTHPEVDLENVWHTLVLLDLPPIERLRRGLLRGQTVNFFELNLAGGANVERQSLRLCAHAGRRGESLVASGASTRCRG